MTYHIPTMESTEGLIVTHNNMTSSCVNNSKNDSSKQEDTSAEYESPTTDFSKQFQCHACKKTFYRKGSLNRHMKAKTCIKTNLIGDMDGEESGSKGKPHVCQLCMNRFSAKRNLLKHLRLIHKNISEAEKLKVKKTRCPEIDCLFTCRKVRELRSHIEKCHGITILQDCLQFTNESVFQKWKREEEANSVSWFVAYRRKNTLQNGNVRQILICHRSGQYNPKGSGKYRLKAHGSCKIGGTCPAAMDVTEHPDGQFTVVYYKTHLGHSQDVVHLHLSKEERAQLSERIEQGFSFDAILEDVREEISPTDEKTKRIHLLSKKDLHNIVNRLNIAKPSKRNHNVRKGEPFRRRRTLTNISWNSVLKASQDGNTKNLSLLTEENTSEKVIDEDINDDFTMFSSSLGEPDNGMQFSKTQLIQQKERQLIGTMNSSNEDGSSQVVLVSPDINYHPLTEVILVRPTESPPNLQPAIFSSEVIPCNEGKNTKPLGESLRRVSFFERIPERSRGPLRGKSKTKRIDFTQVLQDKVQKVSSFLSKSEFLTPKQFEIVNSKLDCIIDVYNSVTIKTKSKKLLKKVSNTKKNKTSLTLGNRISQSQNSVVGEQAVIVQPVYESPLYAYLCNYN